MYDDPEERTAIKGFDETLREAQALVDGGLLEMMARSSRTLLAILDILKALFVFTTLGLGAAVGFLFKIAWG